MFQSADKVLDFGGGQSACYDAILYGYDLIFEREALFGKTKWLGVPNQQVCAGGAGRGKGRRTGGGEEEGG